MYGAIWDEATAVARGTRPNVYIIFRSEAPPPPVLTADGVVHLIAVSDWGPSGEVVDIEGLADANRYLGETESALRTAVLEALKQGARKVSFYRVATGSAAKATLTLNDGSAAAALTVTARYEGTYGQQIRAEVVTALNGTDKELRIYVGTARREVYRGADNDAIVAHWEALGRGDLVDLAVAGAANRALANVSSTPLAGGNSGTSVVSADYMTALDNSRQYRFRTLALDTSDYAIQAAARTWIADERAGGNRIHAVFGALDSDPFATKQAQAVALDNEGVIFLANGYTAADGTVLSPVRASLPVAAAIAVQYTASTTFYVLPGATDVTVKFSNDEYEAGLETGMLFLTNDGEKVKIEQGINTLQPASQVSPRSADWRKIRYMMIQDALVDRVGRYLGDNYIGKVENDERGRREAARQVQIVLDEMTRERLFLQEPPAIAYLDPSHVSDADRVFVAGEGQAVDAIEKFFLTFAL